MGAILRCKLVKHIEKCYNRYVSVCSKCSRLYFCQILFELVYSWESSQKQKNGELFIETQCTSIITIFEIHTGLFMQQ